MDFRLALQSDIARDAQNAGGRAVVRLDGRENVVPILRVLAGDHAHAIKAGIFALRRYAQRAFAALADLGRQQIEPGHAKARIGAHAQGVTTRFVHVRQRSIGADDFDAVHAHVQHLGLGAYTFAQHLLGQRVVVDIVQADEPRHSGRLRQGEGGGMDLAPVVVAAVVLQAIFVAERPVGSQCFLPHLGGLQAIFWMHILQPLCSGGFGGFLIALRAHKLRPSGVMVAGLCLRGDQPDWLRHPLQQRLRLGQV